MVLASDSGPQLYVGAAPAGVHLPGIKHLPPQELGDFLIDRYEVSNRKFQAFVDAGGYEDSRFWKEPFTDGDRELTWASSEIVPFSNLAGTEVQPTGGTRARNRYGAYDLGGNVREWCVNPDNRGGRFILGGAWNDPPHASERRGGRDAGGYR